MRNAVLAVGLVVAGVFVSPGTNADEWQTKLQSVIRQFDANAAVTVEKGRYVYRYHTQTFKIHTIWKTGAIEETAHDEEGPNVDGILLTVSLQDGPYQGAAVVPQDLRDPYWTTFINAYPVATGKHLWLRLCYGSKANKKLMAAIKACFGPGLPPEPGAVNPKKEAKMWCHACGFNLDIPGFRGKSDVYCAHCTDQDGKLNVTREEVQKAMANWFKTWQPNLDDAKAMKRADHYLKALPQWAED